MNKIRSILLTLMLLLAVMPMQVHAEGEMIRYPIDSDDPPITISVSVNLSSKLNVPQEQNNYSEYVAIFDTINAPFKVVRMSIYDDDDQMVQGKINNGSYKLLIDLFIMENSYFPNGNYNDKVVIKGAEKIKVSPASDFNWNNSNGYTTSENKYNNLHLAIEASIDVTEKPSLASWITDENDKTWWMWDEKTKTVTFGGEGEIPDYYGNENNRPWMDYTDYPQEMENVVFQEGISVIGGHSLSFAGKPSLTISLTLPSTLTKIGDSAFYGVETNIQKLTLPVSLTEIGERAFEGVKGIKEVEITSDGINIKDSAFSQMKDLETVTIKANSAKIGQGAFMQNYDLKTVNITGSNVVLKPWAFAGSKSLEEINLKGDNLVLNTKDSWDKNYYGPVFASPNSPSPIKKITISGKNVELQEKALKGLPELKELVFAGENVILGENLFGDDELTKLEDVEFKKNAYSIKNNSFEKVTSELNAFLTLPSNWTLSPMGSDGLFYGGVFTIPEVVPNETFIKDANGNIGATFTCKDASDSTLHINGLKLERIYQETTETDTYKGLMVTCDGTVLTQKTQYSVEAGSIKINLPKTYLDTLSVGEHVVKVYVAKESAATITNNDYVFEAKIKVNANSTLNPAPTPTSTPTPKSTTTTLNPVLYKAPNTSVR